MIRICTVENCGYAVYARGWCQAHYMLQRRGKPLDSLGPRRMTADDREYIINELKGGRSLTDLHNETKYSKAAISVMFKKFVGMNLSEWRRKRAAFEYLGGTQ